MIHRIVTRALSVHRRQENMQKLGERDKVTEGVCDSIKESSLFNHDLPVPMSSYPAGHTIFSSFLCHPTHQIFALTLVSKLPEEVFCDRRSTFLWLRELRWDFVINSKNWEIQIRFFKENQVSNINYSVTLIYLLSLVFLKKQIKD